MIRRDERHPHDYTKKDWMMMPRDYRFFIQVDTRDVVEMEVTSQLAHALCRVPGVVDAKIYPGTNDPNQDLDHVIIHPWDD